MEQGDARHLAKRLNGQGWLTWIATTRDRAAGEWEKTHEWGVMAGDGLFYGSEEELPGIARDYLARGEG